MSTSAEGQCQYASLIPHSDAVESLTIRSDHVLLRRLCLGLVLASLFAKREQLRVPDEEI